MLDGVVYRVLANAGDQRVVQEWARSFWMPSMIPLYRIGDAMIATREQLRRQGVPESDWTGTIGGWPERPRDDAPHSGQT